MNAIGFLHAEKLLADLDGVRVATMSGDGGVMSEWTLRNDRIVLSQGADGRLRLFTLVADADRLKPDVLLDAIAQVHQRSLDAARGKPAPGRPR